MNCSNCGQILQAPSAACPSCGAPLPTPVTPQGAYAQPPAGQQPPGGYPQQPGGYPQQPGGYPQQAHGAEESVGSKVGGTLLFIALLAVVNVFTYYGCGYIVY